MATDRVVLMTAEVAARRMLDMAEQREDLAGRLKWGARLREVQAKLAADGREESGDGR